MSPDESLAYTRRFGQLGMRPLMERALSRREILIAALWKSGGQVQYGIANTEELKS